MFGTNEIVGQKYFRERAGDGAEHAGKYFVTSIFYTLQGEGPYAGMPAVFVRFAKCNLDCIFCDTFFDDGEWLTKEEIAERIRKIMLDYHREDVDAFCTETLRPYSDCENIILADRKDRTVLVLTGGEPMLQLNLKGFIEYMINELCLFAVAQIETNGTVDQELDPYITTVVCSPKCSEKTGRYLKPNPKLLPKINALKFVVSADPNSPYHKIPDWAFEEEFEGDIYISPMNVYNDIPRQSKELRLRSNKTTLEERSSIDEVVSFWTEGLLNREVNQANHEYAARYCMQKGATLNLQMHLYASLA